VQNSQGYVVRGHLGLEMRVIAPYRDCEASYTPVRPPNFQMFWPYGLEIAILLQSWGSQPMVAAARIVSISFSGKMEIGRFS
jgi:hypothetical protein